MRSIVLISIGLLSLNSYSQTKPAEVSKPGKCTWYEGALATETERSVYDEEHDSKVDVNTVEECITKVKSRFGVEREFETITSLAREPKMEKRKISQVEITYEDKSIRFKGGMSLIPKESTSEKR